MYVLYTYNTNIFVHCSHIYKMYYNSLILALCLQSKLQECQKRMDELEAELQRANNKVCHTGHLLNQMTIKVKKYPSLRPIGLIIFLVVGW